MACRRGFEQRLSNPKGHEGPTPLIKRLYEFGKHARLHFLTFNKDIPPEVPFHPLPLEIFSSKIRVRQWLPRK